MRKLQNPDKFSFISWPTLKEVYNLLWFWELWLGLLNEYKEFIQAEDHRLPVNFDLYISKKINCFKDEKFWLERNIQENWRLKIILNFFYKIDVNSISHSNMSVESIFSYACQYIFKSYENYFADKDELLETNVLFELEEDHHKFYKCYIKGE